MPQKYEVVVAISAPAAAVKAVVSEWGTVTPAGADACELRMSVDLLDWPTMVISAVGAPFEVHQPPELAEHLGRVGALLAAAGPDHRTTG